MNEYIRLGLNAPNCERRILNKGRSPVDFGQKPFFPTNVDPKKRAARDLDAAVDYNISGNSIVAICILRELIERGSSAAARVLGQIYETGYDTQEPSIRDAINTYKSGLGFNDNLDLHLALARVYIENYSFDPDHSLARFYFEQLCRNNDARGFFWLGLNA